MWAWWATCFEIIPALIQEIKKDRGLRVSGSADLPTLLISGKLAWTV